MLRKLLNEVYYSSPISSKVPTPKKVDTDNINIEYCWQNPDEAAQSVADSIKDYLAKGGWSNYVNYYNGNDNPYLTVVLRWHDIQDVSKYLLTRGLEMTQTSLSIVAELEEQAAKKAGN